MTRFNPSRRGLFGLFAGAAAAVVPHSKPDTIVADHLDAGAVEPCYTYAWSTEGKSLSVVVTGALGVTTFSPFKR